MLPCARSFGGGMRAASIGVSVSATKSEISTEPATVSAELAEEVADDALDEDHRQEDGRDREGRRGRGEGDLARALRRGVARVLAQLAVPLDVLEHDDRVVDHDADRQRHAEQRHRVERVAGEPHEAEGRDQRDRDRAATISVGRERRRNTKTVSIASSAPKTSANSVSCDRLADRRARSRRSRRRVVEAHALRAASSAISSRRRSDLVDDRDGVAVGLLADADADRRRAVVARDRCARSSAPSSTRATSRSSTGAPSA